MDIISSKQLDWTELEVGSVPCRECRELLVKLRDSQRDVTLHEDTDGGVHLEIRPKVTPGLERAIAHHRDHLIRSAIVVTMPQTLRIERGVLGLDGGWTWKGVEERATTYAKAPKEWDELLRAVGTRGGGQTAYRAIWLAGGSVRRSANFPPGVGRNRERGQHA